LVGVVRVFKDQAQTVLIVLSQALQVLVVAKEAPMARGLQSERLEDQAVVDQGQTGARMAVQETQVVSRQLRVTLALRVPYLPLTGQAVVVALVGLRGRLLVLSVVLVE
jgi:hypothetical protein